MILVFEQLTNRLKAEQSVDKVVSMASKSIKYLCSFQESASKTISSAYSRSMTRVSHCSFPAVPHKFGIVRISYSNTFVLHSMTVQRHYDSVKIQIKAHNLNFFHALPLRKSQ